MLEKILTLLTALIAAIEANTAALKTGAAPTKGKPKAETTASTNAGTPAAPTVDDVRNAATAYLNAVKDKEKQAKFIGPLNAKYGAKRLTEAPADKFGEIIAALVAETERVTKPKQDEPADSGI